MRELNREKWTMVLEAWERDYLHATGWTDREFDLVQEGSQVLFRAAEVVLSCDENPKALWFRAGWMNARYPFGKED